MRKFVIKMTSVFILFSLIFSFFAQAEFIPREAPPDLSDAYYTAPENPFSSADGKGNCTWYAFGRAYEILGERPVFSGNACMWWNDRDAYVGFGDTPRIGAIAVWDGIDAASCGHVAVVEAIDGDRITISESSYGGVSYTNSYWGMRTYSESTMRDGLSYHGSPLYLLGYIYLIPETDGEASLADHEHTFETYTDLVHPHVKYKLCTKCGLRVDTNERGYFPDCEQCKAEGAPAKLSRFTKISTYNNTYTDLDSSAWYVSSVVSAYELGLMQGDSVGTFRPDGSITLAETVALAARIHSIYNTGTTEFKPTDTWYATYVFYARKNGLLTHLYPDYEKPATRAEVAEIFAKALPTDALKQVNMVETDAIPDVSSSDAYSDAVYMLYRAGVLTGSEDGMFFPDTSISRAECAAIISRMAIPDLRKTFTLNYKDSNRSLQAARQIFSLNPIVVPLLNQ